MRLLEAIINANHRALAGDATAGIRPAEFQDALPLIALTCIDPRLNPLMPEVLGIAEEHFIWLRNAGNIITGPMSSTLRSLALACAVKGGREIVIIGHTDCLVCKTSTLQLTERFAKLGVSRAALPANLIEYFGLFSSERQNVLKGVELARASPLIGPQLPVHGLLVDIANGRLEWLVNGYQFIRSEIASHPQAPEYSSAAPQSALKAPLAFEPGELKFPETQIGAFATKVEGVLERGPDLAATLESSAGQIGAFASAIGEAASEAKLVEPKPPALPSSAKEPVSPSQALKLKTHPVPLKRERQLPPTQRSPRDPRRH